MVKIGKPYADIKYVALSFLLGFSIRLIPEVMYPNYPVGYDVAMYAYTIPRIHETPVATMLRGAQLFYLVSWTLLQLTHADIYLLLKMMGPLMYGLLIASLHTTAKTRPHNTTPPCCLKQDATEKRLDFSSFSCRLHQPERLCD